MNEVAASYELVVLRDNYGVCRFGAKALVPEWVDHGSFWSVSRTPDELSIVCAEIHVPSGVQAERGFSCLKVVGPLEFSSVGVLAALTGALATRGISLLTISTFETDYILVRQIDLPDAIDALREAGHLVQF
ncbi:MAG: ACT domain-containing protein [Acidobacteriota bacterium]